ncbi:uncharacterized protein LOC121281399 [Carcharodon carcharias]|uniref:uncharacterized protein LOC121281399 n=1 Tax=Carcharodon carcharias TaxID=13397 RepID=UPI001B7E28AA|nr:uncharacterized protein LOC121281399 [Carcharodon carcharias]
MIQSRPMANSQRNDALTFKTVAFIFLTCMPDLASGQVRYSIPEELEQDTSVGNIARDLRLNVRQLSARKFRLASDDGRPYLKVSLDNGILSIRERIDREYICGLAATCILPFKIVTENPFEIYRGEVEILDVNDNSPSFADNTISLQMSESIAPGVRFPLESAQDPDVGINTVAAYTISPNEHFGLKMQTTEDGVKMVELLLEKPLDREQESSYQLVLTATDGGTPHRSGTVQVLITVLDSNDNPPMFDRAIYRSSLTENAPRGTLVIKVSAHDLDEGPNAEVTYSFSKLASPRVRELFSLDAQTGEIRIEGALDFEETNTYSLDIRAVDNGSPAIAGHSKVLIKVIDENDNAPEIKVTSVSSMVSEDVQRGTLISLINVIDQDSGENGQVHCQISKNIPFKLQTSSSNHYKLITSGILDRETVFMYDILILATDSGSPPLSTNKTIPISVSDVNDNAPQFSQMLYTVYVMENNSPGASIFAVTALDPDMDQNSFVSYAIMSDMMQDLPASSFISVNSNNGDIYALRSFDYEQRKNFQIQVEARDAGVPPLSSSATLNVIILDQNDNAPVIVSPLAQSGSTAVEIVPQSAAQGYLVTKIIATDADSGQNARLSYRVLEATDSSLFNVGLNTGEVRTARGISEHDASTESLVILVKDNGQPNLSSTVTILFSILANVTEKFPESSNLVRNPEYVTDLNLYLIIALGSTTLIFLVIIIFLIGIKCKQDRNIIEGYNSPICCCKREDSNYSYPERFGLPVPLNYTDAGEIVPNVEPYHYTVCLSPESSKTDFLFLKPYVSPLPQEQFYINDWQKLRYFNNKIQPRTMAKTRRGGTPFILLLCVLDLVSGQIRYSIPEELEHGAFVGNIAEDLKLQVWELSAHNCRLVANEKKQYIEVNLENGMLFMNERIDREEICRQSSTCSLSFEIALDNPLKMHRAVVEILDVNDNSPHFSKDEFSLQISELIAQGARFPLESAHDPDIGSNTVSTYQISSNEHFRIKVQTRNDGSKSAELLLEKPLDREAQSTFHLTLTAVDGGIPRRSGTARIIIIVVDVNDNAPLFDHEIYRATIAENTAKGTLVAKINAVDLDEGTNAELTYSFTHHVSESIRELFKLEPSTGDIRVQGVLDFEDSIVYELDVQAVDNAMPGLAGHAKVMVSLIDVNDNCPVIEVTSVSSTVPEDAAPGTVIAVISVTDLDSGVNGQVQCQVPRDVPFKLQRSSKNNFELVTREILDREIVPFHNITISAWDGGSPTLSTLKTILVSVSDINDNAPKFAQSLYSLYLMENNIPGASIFVVKALDLDLDQNGEVMYSILDNQIQGQPGPAYLTINSKHGTIYALRSFDYEQLKQFQIQVQAQDAGSPPLSSTATVNVIILDQNDNAPVIVSPLTWNHSASVEIAPQSVYSGYLLTKIIATDADSGQNSRLCYRLLQATDPSLFTVELHSGEIRATRNVREQDIITERLVILVKDNGEPSLSSTTTISFTMGANATGKPLERIDEPRQSEYFSVLNRYLIIVLGSTSFLFLVTIIFLAALKFKQARDLTEDYNARDRCYRWSNSNENSHRRPAPKEPLNYPGAGETEGYRYTVCLSPESSKSDFLFLKPCHPTLPFSEVNVPVQLRKMANERRGGTPFIFLLCLLELVSGQIRYSIPEELEHGAFVGNIAEDLKLHVWELSSRKIRLLSDDRKQYIEANLENGILFVNERIDRELICRQSSMCSLSLEITLDNPLEIHRAVVEILDINDNSPSFAKDESSLEINELIAPGTRFPVESAHDPDAGTNGISTYQVSSNEHFGIKVLTRSDGNKSAELLLENPLDREQQSSYELVLTAMDGGIPQRSGTARIVITVLDSNDNAPVFDHEIYRTSVAENAALGTLVLKINAADLDEGTNAELSYSFTRHVPRRIREMFRLDTVTGEIAVQGVLDFEESGVCELDVQAVDKAPPGMVGHAKVMVNLIDVNDNAPEIEVASVSSTIAEDAQPGTVIAIINVADRDSGENGQIYCQVPVNVPFKLQKSLRNNYKLVTSDILDHETAPLYNISISAWDGGSPPLSTRKTIVVSISDINDNAPSFTQSLYNAYLMENSTPGASIFAVTAFDSDTDQNGEFAYSIMENSIEQGLGYFTINSKNGNIYSLRSFDYEQLKHFQIKVQAQDAGSPPLSSTAIVNVIILDQNDNAPVIVSPLTWNSSASVAIMPQLVYPGYLVTKVIATDADSGQNARLSYRLLEATDLRLFTVTLLSGEIRATRHFGDQDLITERLVLLVKDNGQPSLSCTATISFTIVSNVTEKHSERTDEAKHSDSFSDLNRYLIIILGSTSFLLLAIILVLITLKFKQEINIAADPSATVYCYRRRSCKNAFNPRPAGNESLNYTGPGQAVGFGYTVCLTPESSKSDFLFLKPCHPTLPFTEVNIRNTNRFSIYMQHWNSVYINELQRLGHLCYKFQPRTMANARRGGTPFIFLLCLLDLVSGQIRYSIPEELEHGAFVGNIAEDLKLNIGELSSRKIRLPYDERKHYIEVNLENGILLVNERIDRELICRQSSTCSLSLEIALENPLEIHRAVVEILDINDNSPSFEKDEFTLEISELIAPGTRFPVESAHDPDAGTNGISTYQVSSNEHFGIKVLTRSDGSKSAELLLENPLDREQQSSYELVLTAMDGGIPQRSGTARIVITVLDSNDNAPVFDHEIYRTSVAENAALGTLVLKINAADLDEGTNAELSYSFTRHVPRRIREMFRLDTVTGEIAVQGVLDFEESGVYELDVQAVDKAPPGMVGHAKVMIELIDVNDNAPEIEVASVSSTIAEDAQPGTVIAIINVADRDSGENGQIYCQVPVNVPFKLQKSLRNNYKLVTSDILDHETAPLYNISISAWDGGSPPLSTRKSIVVSISDINDNAPSFTQSLYNVYLMENNTPGASIFAVTAFDSDTDQNGEFAYSIVENSIEQGLGYFTINSKNGNIYSLRSFDYEQLKHFQIKVQAQDAGSPPLSSTAIVNVIILDQNDNAPVIVSPLTWNSSASVAIMPQLVYPGYLVTKVIATDADSGQNARLSYRLLEATDLSLFTVTLLSGEIRATRHFGDQDIITERLVLLVKDNGQPSLSCTATISFTIVSNITEKHSGRTDEAKHSDSFSDLNRYLIIILGSTSFLFLVIIIFLIALKFKQERNIAGDHSATVCCYRRRSCKNAFNPRPVGNESLNYTGSGQVDGFGYTVCLTPESSKNDFLFLKPCHPTLPFTEVNIRNTNAMT